MSPQNPSRRRALKKIGSLAVTAAAPASLVLATGCTTNGQSRASYITNVVARQNMTPVHYWSDVMLQSVRDLSVPPPPASRAFAAGHLAGMAAADSITGRYELPVSMGDAPEGANPEIAYGIALSEAAEWALNTGMGVERMRFLDAYPNDSVKDRSIAWGRYVGDYIKRLRRNDGGEDWADPADQWPYARTEGPMAWKPTGPFYSAKDGPVFSLYNDPLLPAWGKVKTWAITDAMAFRPNDFPEEGSAEFARQFMKVRDLGGADSKIRTADQEEIAFFWEDGPQGVTPPGHWQIIAMDIMQNLNLDLTDQARFMALLSLAQADAGVATWDCKFVMDVVRPETAIREGGFANAKLDGVYNPNWRTLIPTPPFPAYVSGHSMFSASSAAMLKNLIGTDRISFSSAAPDLVNWPTQLAGVRRSWTSLGQAPEEGGASREYGGIHWEADNTEGLRIGRMIANDIFARTLRAKA